MNPLGKKRALSVASAFVVALLAITVLHKGPPQAARELSASVASVLPIIEQRYVQTVDVNALQQAAIKGAVDQLDSYSGFMTPNDARAFRDLTEGQFGGLGIEITVEAGVVIVIAPIEGTPASDAGILPGDRILAVDGVEHCFRSAHEAAKVLKGDPGSMVRLLVQHAGEPGPVSIEVERAIIHVSSISRPHILDSTSGLGYIRIQQFSPNTDAELEEALEKLTQEGMRALVLDLRSNPGGDLRASIACADLFVDKGVLLRTVGRSDNTEYKATVESTIMRQPLVVLVNGYSASAAEILAGALKDADRAQVVGVRTFGKGSVQQVIGLADGSLLRLTTARFYTSSGRPIHKADDAAAGDEWGIDPHVYVALDAGLLQRLYRRMTRMQYGGSANPSEVVLHLDSQLAKGVELLREQLSKKPTGELPHGLQPAGN